LKRVSENILKLTVHATQNRAKLSPKWPNAARPSTANARSRALPRAPGRNLGLGRESCFPPGPKVARAPVLSLQPSDQIRRPSGRRGRVKPRVAPVPRKTLGPFRLSPPRPLLPASPLPPRDGGRRCGAAAGLLAGECARLDVSAPPSSGLGVACWPTLHGAVEIPSSGWLGMHLLCGDGGSPGLLSLGVTCPWSWELLVVR
jgi:hypothetical protein